MKYFLAVSVNKALSVDEIRQRVEKDLVSDGYTIVKRENTKQKPTDTQGSIADALR